MLPIFSQTTSSAQPETVFRLGRIQENGDWLLPIFVFILLAAYFVHRYRVDAAELKRWQYRLLLLLRIGALAMIFVFYIQPQWEHLVGSSRVALIIDTSASMARRDLVPSQNIGATLTLENEESDHPAEAVDSNGPSRLEALMDWIYRSELIERLLEKHEVIVYSFDKNVRRESEEPKYEIRAEGTESRIGEALFDVLQQERGQPLAGILLLSDGQQNAGRSLDLPLETAQTLRIPVFPIGVGQARQALNFRVGNIDLPERVFPDDPFIVKVPIEKIGGSEEQHDGRSESWTVPVELWMQSPDGLETKVGEKEIHFGNDTSTSGIASGGTQGGVIELNFEIRIPEAGKRRLTAKIIAPDEDSVEEDNVQQAEVEVVDRKDHILLYAGGPSRDYQFLSTQIHRDKSMSVDVYLPWAAPGASQNADKILNVFPSNRTKMSQYDVVVAFDPNWRDLSNEQIDQLEHWVGRMGGGLIVVAGPVNLGDAVTGWVVDMNLDKIRALYPVEFQAKKAAFDHRYHGSEQAWPLKLTQAGEEAEFLRVRDNATESRLFWNDFPGFYGFFALQGVKPTATLYASSTSPETMGRAESGALIVEQFYGAGRVLYLGSSELWRLRRADDKAAEQLTTRLLRHVGQGRLQRESDRGSLVTDKRRYALGGIAQLRITANDIQLQPLTLPKLPIDVLLPSGILRTLEAMLDSNIPGIYQAYLPLTEEGDWSLRLTLPESDEPISRNIQVQISDLERENPTRNETLLRQIAEKTNGVYYANPTDAMPLVKESALLGNIDYFTSVTDNLVKPQIVTELLKIRSHQAVLDRDAEQRFLTWLLAVICSLLMLEWTLRRLMKLA